MFNKHIVLIKWFHHGKLHRESGPAVIRYGFDNEVKSLEWYQHGKKHRENGFADGNLNWDCWYQKGKLHREDGPALIYKNKQYIKLYGKCHWYLNGVRLTEEDFLQTLEEEIIYIGNAPYLKDGRRISNVLGDTCTNT